MITRRIVFENDGKKLTIASLLLFSYVKQGAGARKLAGTIELYDRLQHKASINFEFVPPHNAYNCMQAKLELQVTATHCYLKISTMTGIHEVTELYAIGASSADT